MRAHTLRGVEVQREGVDRRHEVGAEGGVDGAVTGDAGLAGKGRGPQGDAEMALAALLVSGVAAVRFAFVDDVECRGREGRLKPLANFF